MTEGKAYSIKEVFLTVRDKPVVPVALGKFKAKVVNSQTVFRAFVSLNERDVEQFIALHLDTGNAVRSIHVVSSGIVNAALVHCREVFRAAIVNGATKIIVLHNHPSGSPSPSEEDVSITEKLVKAGKIIGIPVLDHIIVGGSTYYSFADKGRMG